MKKLISFMGGALLLVNVNGQSQTFKAPPFRSNKIYIDSRLPDMPLGKFIRYQSKSAKLSDFKNKIIILDFWFIECTDCIRQFPREDSLQREFGNDIQIIPVAFQTEKMVSSFLNKWEILHHTKLSMPFIVDDTLLNKCFSNPYFPHYEWLAPDRRIIAQSSEHFLTKENIKAMIRETEKMKMHLLSDTTLLKTAPHLYIKDLYNYQYN